MKSWIYRNFPLNNTAPNYFLPFDGIRGLAVIMVLINHSLLYFSSIDPDQIGKMGVFLFYILSAYFLDRQIILALRGEIADYSFWKNYFLRRFLRIYPLFFLILIVNLTLSKIGIHTGIENLKDIYLHLTLQKGISNLWSIPVEFKYYFLSPIIVLVCHHIFKWRLKWVVSFLVVLIIGSIVKQIYSESEFLSTVKFLPFFLMGTMFSVVEVVKPNLLLNLNNRIKIALDFFSIIFIVLIVLICLPVIQHKFITHEGEMQSWKFYMPYSVFWCTIIVSCKYGYGLITKVFNNILFRFIGIISFSVYIWQVPILRVSAIHKFNFNTVQLGIVIIVMSLLIGSSSYLIIEKKFQKIRFKK